MRKNERTIEWKKKEIISKITFSFWIYQTHKIWFIRSGFECVCVSARSMWPRQRWYFIFRWNAVERKLHKTQIYQRYVQSHHHPSATAVAVATATASSWQQPQYAVCTSVACHLPLKLYSFSLKMPKGIHPRFFHLASSEHGTQSGWDARHIREGELSNSSDEQHRRKLHGEFSWKTKTFENMRPRACDSAARSFRFFVNSFWAD